MGPRSRYVAALAVLAALCVLAVPSVVWLARSWAVNPYYSHGPLAAIAAAWLLWRRRDLLAPGEPSDAGLALVAAGLALQLHATYRDMHTVALWSLLLVVLGFLLLVRGKRAFRAALLPAALLGLAVPVAWVDGIAPALAGVVAGWASRAAEAVGVDVVRNGAQLSTADGTFRVGGPCSGLRSGMALVTLAVVYAALLDGSAARRAAVVCLAVPIALAANWIRLTGLLVLTDAIGASTTMALYHPLSSPVLFAAAAIVLVFAAGRRRQPSRHAG